MDIQTPSSLQPKFTFTAQLTHALKWIQQRDGLQPDIEHKPQSSQCNIQGNLMHLNSDLARLYQTRDLLIYAFIELDSNYTSTLTLYYFSKSNGENQSKQIYSIRGKIVSMEFTYPFPIKKNNDETTYEINLVMGNEAGFVKIIDFGQKSEIQSFQIDTKSIIDIKVPPPQYFANHPICFALIQDYSIYTVSLKFKTAVAHFRPTIMMCDTSLNLNLHQSMKYLLQTTKGGYLVLWKINQNLFKKLERQKSSIKSTQKIYNVFPTSIIHSASIQGIKWASFLGDLIAIITSKGVFKILALNVEQKQEYALILEYPIQNGDKIKDAKILPKQECLIVVKPENSYSDCIQCIFYSPELLVTHLYRIKINQMPHIDQFILSKNLKYLFLRNKNRFFINFTSVIQSRVSQNKRHNDNFRSLNF